VADFNTKEPVLIDGVPVYTVQLLITTAEGFELTGVKFPSKTVPVLASLAKVKVTGLTVTPYANNAGRSAVSFRASSVEALA
jgi:hypothetical protein